MDNGGNSKEGKAAMKREVNGKNPSLVIIRQPYTYLEPYVRSMFEEAEDIRIIVDRRFHERRQVGAPSAPNRRKNTSDRRFSAPMLDILIDVEA